MNNKSFLQSVGTNFDRASGLLGLSDDLARKIKTLIQPTLFGLE